MGVAGSVHSVLLTFTRVLVENQDIKLSWRNFKRWGSIVVLRKWHEEQNIANVDKGGIMAGFGKWTLLQ